MKEFDLQLFAEKTDDAATESAAVGTAPDTETTEAIPEELAGLPEDIARETMREASTPEPQAADPESEPQSADADSDTKPVSEDETVLNQPNYKVPYTRFKEEIDKKKSLEEQLAAYKSQYGDLPKGNQQSPETQKASEPSIQPPVLTTANQPPAPSVLSMPPIQLDDNTMTQINEAARQQAMQMTGMTKEDVDALEYADTSDTKAVRWKAAMDIAKNNIYSAIRTESARRQQVSMEFMRQHQAAVNGFNSFYKQESAEPDFSDVQKFATGEHFTSLSEVEQKILYDAYARVERNTASPQDIFIVQRYFSDAKQAYRSQHPLPTAANTTAAPAASTLAQKESKLQQAEKHPRSEQVEGSATTDGTAVTPANLQHMLDTMKWDDIPKKYQDILLMGGIE